MTEHKQKSPPPEDDISLYVWAGTIFVASAIIGFCAFVALSRKPAVQPVPMPEPRQQIVPAQPGPEPAEPAPPPQVTKIVPQPPPAPVPTAPAPEGPPRLLLNNLAGTLRLDAPFLQEGERMPLEHTCFRRNISPALSWQGEPPGTQSFVVFFEKKAPEGEEPFVNWILFDIPAAAAELAQGQPRQPVLANGAKHANSDHDNIGYIGPCESKGSFTYALRVFALDKLLDLKPGTGKHDLIRAMNGHIIDAAERTFSHYYRM